MRVMRQEGPLKLFNGVEWASSRAVMVTIGQLCFYDIVKDKLLTFRHFEDNSVTHIASSFVAVSLLGLQGNVYDEHRCLLPTTRDR